VRRRRALRSRVASGLSITTASIPDATVAKEYSATLAGTGGLKPYKWTIASGALPNGITLDKATGELSGSTAGAGVFKFSVQLEDSEGTPATTTVAYKLTVSEPPPSPTTTKLTSSNASVKVGANVTFTATVSKAGGVPTGTVTFRHGGQSLGTGKLNSKGVATLTTSFSAAGVFHFTAIYNGRRDLCKQRFQSDHSDGYISIAPTRGRGNLAAGRCDPVQLFSATRICSSRSLLLGHCGGRVGHQVDGFGRLWEGHHFAHVGRAGQQHHNAVEAERNASVRRRAVFERIEEKSKTARVPLDR